MVLPTPGCSLLRQAASATQLRRNASSPSRSPALHLRTRRSLQTLRRGQAIPVSTPNAGERLREAWRAYSQRRRWRTFRGLIESDYCGGRSGFLGRKPDLSLLLLLLLLLSPLLYATACYCTLPPTIHGGSGPHVLSWPRCPVMESALTWTTRATGRPGRPWISKW